MNKSQKIILTISIIIFSFSTLATIINFLTEYIDTPEYCKQNTFWNHVQTITQDKYDELIKRGLSDYQILTLAKGNNDSFAYGVRTSYGSIYCSDQHIFNYFLITEASVLIFLTMVSVPIYFIWGKKLS